MGLVTSLRSVAMGQPCPMVTGPGPDAQQPFLMVTVDSSRSRNCSSKFC